MPTSPDTLLRRVKGYEGEVHPEPRFVGVDDWAFRRGQSYGTILIDLERGRVIDLLPGRDGKALAEWLKRHPGVEVITRDRWAAFAQAATEGAPQALQVADRWHLLKNLREAVERLLGRHAGEALGALTEAPPAPAAAEPLPPAELPTPPGGPLTPGQQARQARQQERSRQFERVKQLRAEGLSLRRIARATGLSLNPRLLRRGAPQPGPPAGQHRPAWAKGRTTGPACASAAPVGPAAVVRVHPPAGGPQGRTAGAPGQAARRGGPAGGPRPGRRVRRDGAQAGEGAAWGVAGQGGGVGVRRAAELRGQPAYRRGGRERGTHRAMEQRTCRRPGESIEADQAPGLWPRRIPVTSGARTVRLVKGREPVPAGAAIHRHQLCGTTPSSCRLPLADAPAPPPDRSSLRTLLVEDDANEQALLSSYLRMNGHSVEAVPDGCAALESLSRRGRPDFLLLDMHMPRMDGPATVAAVRRAPETAGLKIFAVTGSAPGEFDIPAGGVDGWFQKPLNPARLVEAMERACRLH